MIPLSEVTPEYLKTKEYKALSLKEKRPIIAKIAGLGKKGYRFPNTIDRLTAQKKAEQLIHKKAERLIQSGLSLSLGQNFVYRIDEEENEKGKIVSRKNVLVTDEHEIEAALNAIDKGGVSEDGKYYFVTTKEPDIRAIEALLNRGFGKPKETVDINQNVTFSLRDLALRRTKLLDVNDDTKIIDVQAEFIDNQKT